MPDHRAARRSVAGVPRRALTIAALQVVLRYRNLLAVEDAFRTAKALLATRPVFHKTDAGIRGHVFCTFLALVLRKELIDRLPARRSKLEWQRIIDDLADLSEIDVEQDGRRAQLRTAPGPTSIRSAARSASPCRPSSRRCRPLPEPAQTCGA
jgi:hypothetical protein